MSERVQVLATQWVDEFDVDHGKVLCTLTITAREVWLDADSPYVCYADGVRIELDHPITEVTHAP